MYAAELRVRACEAGIRLDDLQDCGLLALQLLRWLHALPCIDPHRESCYRNLMTTSGSSHFTAAIVGGGPVGLAAGLAPLRTAGRGAAGDAADRRYRTAGASSRGPTVGRGNRRADVRLQYRESCPRRGT